MSEHEVILAIEKYLPYNFFVIHLYSHQQKIKGRANLTFPERLIDLADKVADKYARSPINNHVASFPIAIYFDNLHIANNYQIYLRRLCFQQDANEYLMNKYNWIANTSAEID